MYPRSACAKITNETTVTVNKNHTLYAHWELDVPAELVLRNGEQYELDLKDSFTFKSNDTDIAVVSPSGTITAVDTGTAIITVLDQQNNATQITITVTKAKRSGDLNKDGKVTIADVVLLQKWLLAVPNTDLLDWTAGDMNGDGRLNAVDLTLVKKLLIK